MAKICITGGTGLIGRRLTTLLSEKGHEILILTRNKKTATHNLHYAQWDIDSNTIDADAVRSCDAVIHLAGAGVADKRWTAKRKAELLNSRTQSSQLLVKMLQENKGNVKTVVSSSAIGWYGPDDGKKAFTESDAASSDFLGETCRLWEESISPVTALGIRLVKLRTGIVLSNDGGALKEFKKPLRFGIASILGSGRQIISWIHIDDVCRMYMHALENISVEGVFNAVAPAPVSNKELTLQLAKKMRGRAFITAPVPSFVLQLMLGEMSIEVLKSTTVSAQKIQQSGFQFLYPTIEAALHELITS